MPEVLHGGKQTLVESESGGGEELTRLSARRCGCEVEDSWHKARFDIVEPGVVVLANLAQKVAGDHPQLPSDPLTPSSSTLISVSWKDALGHLVVSVNPACNN